MKEDGCAVQVSKKGFVDLVHQLVRGLKYARRNFEVNQHEWAERDGKIEI